MSYQSVKEAAENCFRECLAQNMTREEALLFCHKNHPKTNMKLISGVQNSPSGLKVITTLFTIVKDEEIEIPMEYLGIKEKE